MCDFITVAYNIWTVVYVQCIPWVYHPQSRSTEIYSFDKPLALLRVIKTANLLWRWLQVVYVYLWNTPINHGLYITYIYINHSHSTPIVLSAIELALWSGVGLTDITQWTIAIWKFLSLIPNWHQKSPTVLYQRLHSSFTHIPCFSPKQNTALLKHYYKGRFQIHLEEELACNAYSKTTCSTDSLQAPPLGHSCDPPLPAWLPISSYSPWVATCSPYFRDYNSVKRRLWLLWFRMNTRNLLS